MPVPVPVPVPVPDGAAAFLCSAGVPACDDGVTMRDGCKPATIKNQPDVRSTSSAARATRPLSKPSPQVRPRQGARWCAVQHNGATGHSTGRTIRHGSSGSEGGRRRTISVVSNDPATHHDHAARATLGRLRREPRRPRRPELRVGRNRSRDRNRNRSRSRNRNRDRNRGRGRHRSKHAGTTLYRDVRGTPLCLNDYPVARATLGRRVAIGVPGVPEGRGSSVMSTVECRIKTV